MVRGIKRTPFDPAIVPEHTRLHMRTFILIPAFLLFLPGMKALAQEPGYLSVDEAVIHSLQQNLDLRIEGMSVLDAQEQIEVRESQFDTILFASAIQRGSRNPAWGGAGNGISNRRSSMRAGVSRLLNTGAEVELSTNYQRNSRIETISSLDPAHSSDLSMSLRQPLLQGFGPTINLIPVRQAEFAYMQAELFLKTAALDTMSATENAYWDLAYAHEVKKVRTASLEVAEQLLEENRERERVGLATNIEVLQAEASLATRQEAIITADAMIENSQDTLFRRMGSTEYPEDLLAVNPLPDFSGEPMGTRPSLITILANNPTFLNQQLNVRIAELAAKSSRNSTYPQVDLIAGVGYSGLDDDPIDSYGNTLERDGYDWTAGVEFRVPWGQRGDKARYQQTLNLVRRQEMRLEELKQDFEIANRNRWRSWESGIARVEAAKLSLELSSEQFEREQTKYQSGLSTFRELLESQEDFDEANLRFLNAILDAIKAKIGIMALDVSLPFRYNLTWETTESLIAPEAVNP